VTAKIRLGLERLGIDEAARHILSREVMDAFAQMGQSMAALGTATTGQLAEISRQAIAEAARIEAEQGRLAQWEEICRAPIVGIDIWYEYENSPRGHCECSACRQQREMYGRYEVEWSSYQTGEADADSRAYSLLLSCLSPTQRKEFKREGRFTVKAPSGRKYRIEKGYNFNITVVLSDERDKGMIGRLCAGPAENIPVYDSMLAQKLWLENNEEGFLRVANPDGFFEEPPDCE